ncbi:MAG: ribonucleoside-diphosphate reductase subunit alpha [Candidatus Marithrix sp.]
MSKMFVIKRNGNQERIMFDKITFRVSKLCYGLNMDFIDAVEITQKVISGVYPGITTVELDTLAAETAAFMTTKHPDYALLAARIAVSNLHKETKKQFSDVMTDLYNFEDPQNKRKMPLLSKLTYGHIMANKDLLNSAIIYDRDYNYQYFGIKTLEKSYLLKINGKIVERPQHMLMRVSVGIHGTDIDSVIETYNLLSERWFIHASPTLFNAGTPTPQLSSCFLLAMKEDSIDGIYDTLKMCANISKTAGGIGLNAHCIRGKGSYIAGTNGTSNGIVPMLRVFNNTARYVDQCVKPETIIYTSKGPLQIQELLQDEDEIINLTGSVEKVQNILEHPYNGPIWSISTDYSSSPLEITPEHPVYVLHDQGNVSTDIIQNRLEKGLIQYEWCDVKDIKIGDMLVHKIPTYEKDLELTEDDCYMYGILTFTGGMDNDDTTHVLNLPTKNKIIINFVKEYLEKKVVKYYLRTKGVITKFYWDKTVNLPFKFSDFNTAGITSRFLNLPINKIKFIMNSFVDYFIKDNCNNYITIKDCNYYPYESLRYLALRLGKVLTFQPYDSHKFKITLVENPRLINQMILSKVTSKISTTYSGVLYDLQMKEEHNYMIHNGIIHNGGGKRPGAFAVYLEPWHSDIEDVLELKKNTGAEELRARDLFYGLWVPDLFMERCESNGMWSLFSPDVTPDLENCYGEEFEKLYVKYEQAGVFTKQIKAQELWFKILESQIETGGPYMCYKDHVNKKSNHKNLGTIKNSNLCVAPETLILTDQGHRRIDQLSGSNVNVWNGVEFSKVMVHQTSPMTELIKVNLSDGTYLECTPEHKFVVVHENVEKRINAEDLTEDHVLIKWTCPIISNGEDLPNAYERGFNGSYTVPFRAKLSDKLKWLSGCIDVGGFTHTNNVRIRSNNRKFLNDVMLLLQTMGCFSNLVEYFKGIGVYFLDIQGSYISKLTSLGLKTERVNLDSLEIDYLESRESVRMTSIEHTHRMSPTYCFNEPKRHMGVFNGINCSNCTEIMQYSSPDEVAVCNLASISLPMFIQKGVFNFTKLAHVISVMTRNLNKIIDINYYPVEEAKVSNLRHRPIGLGVQGLADAFILMRYPFESDQAKLLNIQIFETIYYAALETSCQLAQESGTYETYQGSPISEGKLQFDLWNMTPTDLHDWATLKARISEHGVRNSLLVAPMPTASTAQILGNNESVEPYTSNIYTRRVLSGSFQVVNNHLLKDLTEMGIWNDNIKNQIIADNGSIQNISIIPDDIKLLYKTVWEISQRTLIDMSADRGAFVDQSQSFNVFIKNPNFGSLTSMHFYAWKHGLKTGMYYLRTRPAVDAIKFTVDQNSLQQQITCSIENREACEMCSG